MIDLPSIFDSRGAFAEISDEARAALSDAQRAVYEKNKRAADNLKIAESALSATIENIKTGFDAVVEMENYIAATFPKMTFHNLWKQTVKGT